MFRTTFVRDGKNQIIGTKTSNDSNGLTVARDRDGRILGQSNERFDTASDSQEIDF